MLHCGCKRFDILRVGTLFEAEGEEGAVTEKEYTADKEKIYGSVMTNGTSRLQNGDQLWLTLYVNELPTVYFMSVRTGEAYP